ncbi:hypothetical protein IV203_027311 [Nitzschia inconspicua]|uniref:Uncharacterized protein n=1 Tax=Nitzschia inconspicua TaxID=303405 RepID=A0A9K3Q414_9STRA|nr:hypothetical protein IV203_027311 [Nitzschia inconspicua]
MECLDDSKYSTSSSKSVGFVTNNKCEFYCCCYSDFRDIFIMSQLKPGQRYPTPTPGHGDRVFYESLLKQRPNSEMAQEWCLHYGILSTKKSEKLLQIVIDRKKRQRTGGSSGTTSPAPPLKKKKKIKTEETNGGSAEKVTSATL